MLGLHWHTSRCFQSWCCYIYVWLGVPPLWPFDLESAGELPCSHQALHKRNIYWLTKKCMIEFVYDWNSNILVIHNGKAFDSLIMLEMKSALHCGVILYTVCWPQNHDAYKQTYKLCVCTYATYQRNWAALAEIWGRGPYQVM